MPSHTPEEQARLIEPSQRPFLQRILEGIHGDIGLGPMAMAPTRANLPVFGKTLVEAADEMVRRGVHPVKAAAAAFLKTKAPNVFRSAGLGLAEEGANKFKITDRGGRMLASFDTFEEAAEVVRANPDLPVFIESPPPAGSTSAAIRLAPKQVLEEIGKIGQGAAERTLEARRPVSFIPGIMEGMGNAEDRLRAINLTELGKQSFKTFQDLITRAMRGDVGF